MNNDDVIWSIINNTFCSFLVKTKSGKFCRNTDNVTGQCNRHSCPLANSQYATVKEEKGVIYLYLKVAERAPYPAKLWEKVKLSASKKRALEQIEEHMIYWSSWQRRKVRLRLERLREYLKQARRLSLARTKRLVPLSKKIERRETRREAKALIAAQLETTIEKEVLARLKDGGQEEIFNINQKAFDRALEAEEMDEGDDEELEEELDSAEDDEGEEETDEDVVYTSGSDLEEEEEEDLEDLAAANEEEEREKVLVETAGPSHRRGKPKATVTVEYEDDDD